MSILTKKEIEAVECFDIGDDGCITNALPISKAEERYLVYVEDFLALKETLEEAVKAIESNRSQLKQIFEWDGESFETMKYVVRGQFEFNDHFLSQYEKKN